MVVADRERTIAHLLSIVDGPLKEGEQFYRPYTPRNLAMNLLGKLRAKEAVPHLVRWLSPKPGQGQVTTGPMIFSPAGYALVEIGLPAVVPLFSILKTDKDDDTRWECTKMAVAIMGLRHTEFALGEALARETDTAPKKGLQEALDAMKDVKLRRSLDALEKTFVQQWQ